MADGLPDRFPPPEKGYSLYEQVEYREYWRDPALGRQEALEGHLIGRMLPASGRRLIDLGSGYGRLAPLYLDRFEQVVLFDGSLSLLRQARETLGERVTLVAGDLALLPFRSAAFDCVLTIRVLQHVHDLPRVLSEARRIVARDGDFVFSYYNKRNAKRMLRHVDAGTAGDPFSTESAEVEPTLIAHHPRRMGSLLAGAGLSRPEYQGAVVRYAMPEVTRRLGRKAPAGAGWAKLLGRLELAPWLIGRSRPLDGNLLVDAASIDDIFRCPACAGGLHRHRESLECSSCGRDYPIVEGILDFRPATDRPGRS